MSQRENQKEKNICHKGKNGWRNTELPSREVYKHEEHEFLRTIVKSWRTEAQRTTNVSTIRLIKLYTIHFGHSSI